MTEAIHNCHLQKWIFDLITIKAMFFISQHNFWSLTNLPSTNSIILFASYSLIFIIIHSLAPWPQIPFMPNFGHPLFRFWSQSNEHGYIAVCKCDVRKFCTLKYSETRLNIYTLIFLKMLMSICRPSNLIEYQESWKWIAFLTTCLHRLKEA